MKTRLFFFIVATALSTAGVLKTYELAAEILKYEHWYQYGLIVLYLVAWILYFIIVYHWVKYRLVPFSLKVYGNLVGWLAVVTTFIWPALVLAGTGIILMIYISMDVPSDRSIAKR